MTARRRPSSVDSLRRGVGAAPVSEQQPSGEISALATPARPRPEKPVRFTLDLDRERHRFLKEYAVKIEADASQVLRALIDQLRDDPALVVRVQERIWQRG